MKVIISKQSTTTFSDKEQIWADNASRSLFFDNVYVCWVSFRGQEKGHGTPAPLIVATSTTVTTETLRLCASCSLWWSVTFTLTSVAGTGCLNQLGTLSAQAMTSCSLRPGEAATRSGENTLLVEFREVLG